MRGMFAKPPTHPLKWWQFYVACLVYTTSGVVGAIGDTGTILGGALYLLRRGDPAAYARIVAGLSSLGSSEDLPITIPLGIGGSILLARLLIAPFAIYREKPTPENTGQTLRNKTLRLAEEISQFVAMCRATRPKEGMIPYDEANHWIAVAASARAAHSSETGRLYYDLFAKRVMDLREELSQAGIVDVQLDAVYLNPASDDDVATVGQRLRALADRLPAV